MDRRRLRLLACLLACLPAAPAAAPAQIPRHDYLRFLPRVPPIIEQTAASARLALYGDAAEPAYRDVDPADGIDDGRAERLRQLAERFSPILRRNNTAVPRDIEHGMRGRAVLHVDTWVESRLARSDSVDLTPLPLVRLSAATGFEASMPGAAADSQLLALLEELSPLRPLPRSRAPERDAEKVLFIDQPGDGPASWRATLDKGQPVGSRIYAHFFVHESPAAGADAANRYQLVVQYWFFYPFSDGPNDHEGDWEHINVSITTRARAADTAAADPARALLSEADLRRLLAGDSTIVDSTLIHLVEYYVHEYIVTLNYLELASRPSRTNTPHSAHRSTHIWEDADFEQVVVQRRLAVADGRLATHPVGYLGGDNKGPDELLHPLPRFRLSYNRNSDATYPFPGVWARVGPAHATEKVYGAAVPRIRTDADTLPWHELIDDDRIETYRRDEITLLPDWECIHQLVRDDPTARRRWGWLVLPVRLGYPATPSPGAGIVRRADTGNISPLAPTYNPAWNRLGPSSKYETMEPTVLRASGTPVTPWANLQNGWGVLNYPMAALGLLPGAGVAMTQLVPWATGAMNFVGAPPLRTFVQGSAPPRITSEGQGLAYQFGGRDFAYLLPSASDVAAALDPPASGTIASERRPRRTPNAGPRLWFNLYYGSRFSVENSFTWNTSSLSYRAALDGQEYATVRGQLALRELAGGFRYNAVSRLDNLLQLYVRGGYAWTKYEVRDIHAGALSFPDRVGGHLPSFLPSHRWRPNTIYAGGGIELFAPRHRWLLHRLGYGVRAEVSGLRHRLDRSACDGCGAAVTERGDAAVSLVLGW